MNTEEGNDATRRSARTACGGDDNPVGRTPAASPRTAFGVRQALRQRDPLHG